MDNTTKQRAILVIGILAALAVALDPNDIAIALGADAEYIKTLFRIFIALITGLSSATGIAFLKR